MDLVRRDLAGVVFVQYELLVDDPEMTMRRLYRKLDMEPFDGHDFDDVANDANDVDALWLNKFEHIGDTKVRDGHVGQWKDLLAPDIVAMALNTYPQYAETFGYH